MQMDKKVDFYFDVGSPSSYLAWTQLPALCERARAQLIFRPMLLGGVYQATGNSSPATIPAKGRYTNVDFLRFAQRYGVTLTMNPHFPIITLYLMRAVVGMQLKRPERFDAFLSTVFKGLWIDALNLNEAALNVRMFTEGGFDPAEIDALTKDSDVKATLRATTEEAVGRGVFGAPTMFVGDAMFFGQDRLDFVREALA